mmetsp:Transcript_133150/g.385192  ORF Transcript_133150/g.385192 Transcript_133150/m.385192 type:complete len:234 (-) Transcript_133150:151-852(-)
MGAGAPQCEFRQLDLAAGALRSEDALCVGGQVRRLVSRAPHPHPSQAPPLPLLHVRGWLLPARQDVRHLSRRRRLSHGREARSWLHVVRHSRQAGRRGGHIGRDVRGELGGLRLAAHQRPWPLRCRQILAGVASNWVAVVTGKSPECVARCDAAVGTARAVPSDGHPSGRTALGPKAEGPLAVLATVFVPASRRCRATALSLQTGEALRTAPRLPADCSMFRPRRSLPTTTTP